MKIEIEGIVRECQTVSVPKGCYCVFDLSDGAYGFPIFAVIAPTTTENEKACGNVIVGPLFGFNEGFEFANPYEICQCLPLHIFRRLVIGQYRNVVFTSIVDAIEVIYDDFKNHGVNMEKDLREYVAYKQYLTDEEMLKAEKEYTNGTEHPQ